MDDVNYVYTSRSKFRGRKGTFVEWLRALICEKIHRYDWHGIAIYLITMNFMFWNGKDESDLYNEDLCYKHHPLSSQTTESKYAYHF